MPWTTQHPPAHLALHLIEAVYTSEYGGAGCCLHIVLDDGNDERSSILWCREHIDHYGMSANALVPNQPICQTCDDCAKMLLLLSPTARKKAIATWELGEIRKMHAERDVELQRIKDSGHKGVQWVRLTCA